MRFERALVDAGAAALLLGTLGALGALATAPAYAADPAPVDAVTTLRAEPKDLAPGRTLQLSLVTDVVAGTVPKLASTISLPPGVTYLRPEPGDLEYTRCLPSPDGRSVTCRSLDAPHRHVWEQLTVKVGEGVAVGTELTFTATTDIGDAVDAKPENNTASAAVKVGTGPDLGITWKAPSGGVRVGRDVPVDLVITNHGPGTVKAAVARFSTGWKYLPTTDDKRCWWDPGTAVCETYEPLAPGESVSFTFTWNFPEKAAGTTYRGSAGLMSADPLDPVQANDEAELVLRVLKATAPTPTPTPKPTPTPTGTPPKPAPTPTPTASTAAPAPAPATQSGGGALADTGSGPLGALAGTAAALTGAGVLLARARRRRG
ncbi:hypothetical protein [Streptomyces sp. NPDC013740]|uniref:hypothetical protein n=1 Tax=Streptomyces sp. NPDC013740 TaxID=3364867 RepID=UPI0036FEC4B4